jgi:Phospholipid-translocating ATPase N-terminal
LPAVLTLASGDPKRYPNNVISNVKYNSITFIPVVLFEEVWPPSRLQSLL